MANHLNRVTTKTLAHKLADRKGLPRKQTYDLINEFMQEVIDTVSVPNNAWFHLHLGILYNHTYETNIRNPQTGEDLGRKQINTLRFKTSKKRVTTEDK